MLGIDLFRYFFPTEVTKNQTLPKLSTFTELRICLQIPPKLITTIPNFKKICWEAFPPLTLIPPFLTETLQKVYFQQLSHSNSFLLHSYSPWHHSQSASKSGTLTTLQREFLESEAPIKYHHMRRHHWLMSLIDYVTPAVVKKIANNILLYPLIHSPSLSHSLSLSNLRTNKMHMSFHKHRFIKNSM